MSARWQVSFIPDGHTEPWVEGWGNTIDEAAEDLRVRARGYLKMMEAGAQDRLREAARIKDELQTWR